MIENDKCYEKELWSGFSIYQLTTWLTHGLPLPFHSYTVGHKIPCFYEAWKFITWLTRSFH